MLKVNVLFSGKHRVFYAIAASLVALMSMLAIPAMAHAVPTAQGARELFVGGGSGYFDWRESSDFLHVRSGPAALSAGQCADAIFDWARDDWIPGADHHDARIVRSCQAHGWHSTTQSPDTGGSLIGMQKAGYCIGPDNATTSGTCGNAFDAQQVVQGNVNVSLPNNCVRAWKKNSNGTTVYYSGGSSTSCTS